MKPEDIQKAAIVCLFFFSFVMLTDYAYITFLGTSVSRGSDFFAHYSMASGNPRPSDSSYPKFFAAISSPFAFNYNYYYYFTIFLLTIVFPLALVALCRDWRASILYFCTNFFWRMDLMATYPQAILTLWLVFFIYYRKFWFRLASLPLSMFVHSQGFIIFGLAWLASDAYFFLKRHHFYLHFLPAFILCNGSLKLGELNNMKLGGRVDLAARGTASIGDIARFFIRDFNFFLFLFALKGFKKRERLDFILVALIIFVAGFFVHLRVWLTICLIGVVGMTWFIEDAKDKRFRRFFWVMVVASQILVALLWVWDKYLVSGMCP